MPRASLFPDLSRLEDRLHAKARAMEPTITFRATPKQVEFVNAWRTGKYMYMAIGGGIRGTKTIACLTLFVLLCRIFPRSRWAVVRKDLPTIRRNVIPSMEKVRLWSGGFVGELNQSTWTYTCANGSEIILFSEQIQQDPELERWKGLEVNGFDLEECSELAEKSANKAIERAGSWIIPATPDDPTPKQPPPLILFNFNPCPNWPRKWFFEPHRTGSLKPPYYFLPATILDNPFATKEYKESLKHLPPAEYKRFVEGEWDFVDNPKQLIKTEWIWQARNVEYNPRIRSRIGADIARFGDDKSSIFRMKGNQLSKFVKMSKFDNVDVGDMISLLASEDESNQIPGEMINVDGVGLGAGVVDHCTRNRGLPVREIISGIKHGYPRPGSFFKYKDLRAQIWWEGREKLRRGEISLYLVDKQGNDLPLPENLVQDLTSIEYDIDGDKVISVESKDELKKPDRLGRSPDDGDAFMYAIFDMPPRPSRPILPGTIQVIGA